MLKDMLNAAVIAAVDAVSDKSANIKEDITAHLIENVFVGEQIEGVTKQVHDMIEKLGSQFEVMPRNKAQLAGYIFEHLDLPRGNVDASMTKKFVTLATAGIESNSIAIEPTTFAFGELPNQTITVLHVDENDIESEITHTIVTIKVSESKLLMFVLTKSVTVFSVTVSGEHLLVEELKDYTVQQLGQALESIKDTDFAPALMSDREVITVTDLTAEWAQNYHESNPDKFTGRGTDTPRGFIDVLVNAFVKEAELDVVGKRVELEHHDALMEYAVSQLNEEPVAGTPVEESTGSVETPTLTEEEIAAGGVQGTVEEAVPVQPDGAPKPEDDVLFSQGVAEQTQETAAPLTTSNDFDLFDDGIEDAVIVEDDDDILDSTQVAVKILKEFAADSARAVSILDSSSGPIKETLYREVLNTLPSVQKRSSVTYSELEKDNIKTELNKHVREVLQTISEYKAKAEQEHLASLPYNPKMVEEVITSSPVHSSFLENEEARQALSKSVSDYLNGNSGDSVLEVDEPKKRVSEVLRKISLYDYESEALINSTYRATNVPPAEKMIRNTKVIARTLTKTYKSLNVWSGEQAQKIEHAYGEIFNGAASGLDLNKETVDLILNSGLEPKSYTKTGEFITIKVPVADPKTTASVIVITAGQARILNINTTQRVVGAAVTVERANQRDDILNLILE